MAGITADAVFTAADRHYRETGRVPSKEQIREALGHTGSFATIQRHLADWRDTLPARLAFKLDVPDAPPAFAEACRNLWLVAVEEAGNQARKALIPLQDELHARSEQVEELLTSLQEAQKAVEQAKLDALRAIEAAEARAITASQRANTLQQLFQEREARIKEQDDRVASLLADLQAKETLHKTELETAYSRAEETESRLIQQIETEKARLAKHQEQAEKQLRHLNEALDNGQKAHSFAEKQIRELGAELASKAREIETANQKNLYLQEAMKLKDALIDELKKQRKSIPTRKSTNSPRPAKKAV